MTEFTYEKKVKLRDKIQKSIKNKDELIYIKTLLKTHNPNLCMTKNSNGYFIDMLNLTHITYIEISKFIDKLYKKRSDEDTEASKNTKTDECVYDKTDDCVDTITQKKLKFKNSESHILNRVKYEKALKKHQSEDQVENEPDPKPSNIFKRMKK
jgi:DNA gyrase/topoisomerase IV subunit A